MNRKLTTAISATLAVASLGATLPVAAFAQNGRHREAHALTNEIKQRQNTKNQWRNLSILGGAATLYGLLKHDNTVTFAGAAGALYSLNRYEQDRKSQSKDSQARAALFSKPYFVRDGHRYDRVEVVKNGQHYYQFRRH